MSVKDEIDSGRTALSMPVHSSILNYQTESDIGQNIRIENVSDLGESLRDYFFFQDTDVFIVERCSGHHWWEKLRAGWNNLHLANPTPVILDNLYNDWQGPQDISKIDYDHKLVEVVRRALPEISFRSQLDITKCTDILLRPKNIATIKSVANIITMRPVTGIELAIGNLFFIGNEITEVVKNIKLSVSVTLSAQREADLDEAVTHLVNAVCIGGDSFFALLTSPYNRKIITSSVTGGGGKVQLPAEDTDLMVVTKPFKKTAPLIIPQRLPICKDIDTATAGSDKKQRYRARMAVIKAAKNNPNLAEVSSRFERNNRAIERAKLADDMYIWGKDKLWADEPERLRQRLDALTTTHPPEGWKVVVPYYKDSETGFVYAVYQSEFEEPSKPVLVFRGTDNDDERQKDWRANFANTMGIENEQYSQSIYKALRLRREYGADGFEIVGHSKAGGQAAAASIVTGAKGYTFNAAGLHENLIKPYVKNRDDALKLNDAGVPIADAFNHPYDVLSSAQDSLAIAKMAFDVIEIARSLVWGQTANSTMLDSIMPSAAGSRHELPAQDLNGNLQSRPGTDIDGIRKRFGYHGMAYLINSMERQKQDDLQTIASGLGCH